MHSYAQTNVQLFNQLRSEGYSKQDRERVREAYVFAMHGGGPIVVENRKGVFSRYPKKETGSWRESDRGGTRLCEKVHNVLAEWKIFLDVIC